MDWKGRQRLKVYAVLSWRLELRSQHRHIGSHAFFMPPNSRSSQGFNIFLLHMQGHTHEHTCACILMDTHRVNTFSKYKWYHFFFFANKSSLFLLVFFTYLFSLYLVVYGKLKLRFLFHFNYSVFLWLYCLCVDMCVDTWIWQCIFGDQRTA